MSMPVWAWIVIAVAVVLVVAAVAWAMYRRRRSRMLRGRFGPEYDRAVAERGGRWKAESELAARQRRRQELDIRPLEPAARERYMVEWRGTKARFVDDPGGAVAEADRLITQVMRDRGYPMEDFEQRSADISVDHANVVDDYRAAHAISMANDHGQASTEDLRQAMVHYRRLFEDLLETRGPDRSAEVG
jgi:hypothetical protein